MTTSNSSLGRQRKPSKQLEKGWAIPVLNMIYDRDEQSGSKVSAEKPEEFF